MQMIMMRICVSPFVVRYKEFWQDEQTLEVCLVMEYCEDGDLFKRQAACIICSAGSFVINEPVSQRVAVVWCWLQIACGI